MIVPADAIDLIAGEMDRITIWKGSKKPGFIIRENNNIGIHLKEMVYRADEESLRAAAERFRSVQSDSRIKEAVRKNKEAEERAKREKKKRKERRKPENVNIRPGNISDAITALKKNPGFKRGIVAEKVIEEKAPSYRSPHGVEMGIYEFLKDNSINLYSHQTEAIEYAVSKKNVIITTPTASGKTLAFLIPVLNSIIKNPASRALLIYPTKALISDQLKAIREIAQKILPGIFVEKYDGDLNSDERRRIRQRRPSIVITNPDMLNAAILPHHQSWNFLFSSLDYVVMDEAHTYRGVFGSHIALLTRRLRLISAKYRSNPAFILSSATIANPVEHAKNLTGGDFVMVNKSGSKQNEKRFIFFKGGDRISPVDQTAQMLAFLSLAGIQTLCFARTRKSTELIADAAKQEIRKRNYGSKPEIVSYRSGYRYDERARIESDIKSGRAAGVCSTNALELGIDIGSLDCVIISGYPGSVMSTWQQAGRAGRKDSPALVIFMGFNSPLERYILENPDEFFTKSSEYAAIDASNKYILYDHLVSAMNEYGYLSSEHDRTFGCDIDKALTSASRSAFYSHLIVRSGNIWKPAVREYVQGNIRIRNSSHEVYTVKCRGCVIETLSEDQAYREGHKGAIILHGDTRYRVRMLNTPDKTVTVTEENTENYTFASSITTIKISGDGTVVPAGSLHIRFGSMIVQEKFFKYSEYDGRGKIREEELDLRPINIDTRGLWFTVPKMTDDEEVKFSGGLAGLSNILSVVAPHFVLCDPGDMKCVAYSEFEYTDGAPTVVIFDNFMGGVGLSEKARDILYDIFKMAFEIVTKCRCKKGCISCVYSHRDNDEREPDKEMTVRILTRLMKAYRTG
ncbi:DEAD/DEAH box helicase [Methanoplanus limicola]|uniref:DEAD/DEAH box helicase domain protein n=1 Tax=Methanoplanus limicola DSM 2279 TaxID=937775 RepID=H1Z072_9EURY|nr:DEAD/DEAH box helicase [Methanoplanus limicola]EHQ36164.1 DEAD/DEAH box helicase domain protein [Methanoplanus limicola DSM 2279]